MTPSTLPTYTRPPASSRQPQTAACVSCRQTSGAGRRVDAVEAPPTSPT